MCRTRCWLSPALTRYYRSWARKYESVFVLVGFFPVFADCGLWHDTTQGNMAWKQCNEEIGRKMKNGRNHQAVFRKHCETQQAGEHRRTRGTRASHSVEELRVHAPILAKVPLPRARLPLKIGRAGRAMCRSEFWLRSNTKLRPLRWCNCPVGEV